MSSPTSSEVNYEPEPTPAGTRSPTRLRMIKRLSMFLIMFGIAFTVSWFTRPTPHDEEETKDEHAVVAEAEPRHPETSDKPLVIADHPIETIVDRLPYGDRYLTEYNFPAALAVYKEAFLKSNKASGSLLYRMALCLEGLGNWDKALPLYRAAASDEQIPALRLHSQLSQARILMRLGKSSDARLLLYPLVMSSDGNEAKTVISDAHYLLGILLASDIFPPKPKTLSMTSLVYPNAFPLDIELELRDLQTITSAKKKSSPTEDEIEIEPGSNEADPTIQRLRYHYQTAEKIFEQLAKATKYELHWSPKAKEVLSGRSLVLRLDDRLVSEVWMMLADRFDLSTQFDGRQLHLFSAEDVDEKIRHAHQHKIAQAVLHGALNRYPEHPRALKDYKDSMAGKKDVLKDKLKGEGSDLDDLHRLHPQAAAAFFCLGHLDWAEGKLDEACLWFEKLQEEARNSPLCVLANFNLGIIHSSKGETYAARDAFFRTIDNAPSHELVPLAYLLIGRSYLEAGNTHQALLNLERAQKRAAGSTYLPYTTIHLACAYLFDQSPERTQKLLAQTRIRLLDEEIKPSAVLLESISRFRQARSRGTSRVESALLVEALARMPQESPLGMLGMYLQGLAYRELNLWGQAADSLEKALPHMTGPIVPATRYQLAEMLLQNPDREKEAYKIFRGLAEIPDKQWSMRARLHLAKIDLREGRYPDAITHCARIWHDQRPSDLTDLLRTWGGAYEAIGDSQKAANCYAGTPPE